MTLGASLELFFLFGLAFIVVPFVLPIISWVSSRNTRARVDAVEAALKEQERTIDALKAQLATVRRETREAAPAAPSVPARQVPPPIAVPASPPPTVSPVKPPEPVLR
jgi:hypothetical protein